MTQLPTPPEQPKSLIISETARSDQDPVAVYLAGLHSNSRRTMQEALDTIAQLGLGTEAAVAQDVPWPQLRFQHTQAVRSVLAEKYAYTTANRMLSALRGVLKAAWKLGLMSAEDYQKAASVESIRMVLTWTS